ncbi:TniQ family protein [Streptomyces olivoreticuli]|uniref:TniQ family protein n=1 Tax=Streptomyces olivoreticuli TaxID=68246 RepID=UPI00265B1858|nr:TniQ family protein [Streptomyces olivoreticuli]WKK21912.1 TniQ family protein [Streptomyces olivoreticuli]
MPARGEAFASWVDRLAVVLDVPPGQAARVLGLECRRAASVTSPVFFGVTLTPASLEGLRAATGLPARVLWGMQLARYDGTALDLGGLDMGEERTLTAVTAREWMTPSSSRACPRCLAEGQAWPLWWRLGVAAVCPVHGTVLADVCPACGIRLRRGAAGARPRGLLTRPPIPEPGTCGARLPGRAGLCGQVLGEMECPGVPEEAARLQQRVLSVAEGGPARIAGTAVSAGAYFAAIRWLAALARLVADEEDLAVLPGVAADAFAREIRRREHALRGGAGSKLAAIPGARALPGPSWPWPPRCSRRPTRQRPGTCWPRGRTGSPPCAGRGTATRCAACRAPMCCGTWWPR